MNEFLLIIIGIVLIANCAFTIWSFYSLRKILKESNYPSAKNDLNVDHVVYARSSLNLIYASIAIITFVLTFLGFNLKDKITQDVTKEISASARIDLEILNSKANEIVTLDSIAELKNREIGLLAERARFLVSEISKNPQTIFVIRSLRVTKEKHHFSFSELKTIDNTSLPTFSKRPFVLNSVAYYDNGNYAQKTPKATNDDIEFGQDSEPYNLDLVIFLGKQ